MPAAPGHLVQIYETATGLEDAVCDFLAPAFSEGDPVIVVATAEHRQLFLRKLEGRGIDVGAARRLGHLMMLDAAETLGKLMVDGSPSWSRFETLFSGIVQELLSLSGRGAVRVYGEMVDLLWQSGQKSAAIVLEEHWTNLGRRYPFSILCAYLANGFANSDELSKVCSLHDDVITSCPAYTTPSHQQHPTDDIVRSIGPETTAVLLAEIQARKQAERELKEALAALRGREHELTSAQQDLRDFVDNGPVGMHWVGPDGIIQWANRAELEFLGYAESEYIGHPIAEFHADAEVIADILHRLGHGETLHNYEARLRAKDGTLKSVIISSNVYRRDGKFIHTRCFTRDIADRKAMEEELHKKELEARAARQQAEEACRTKDAFMAMLGHELRNPLTPILTALQLMEQRYGDIARKERSAIERQVTLLIRLVDDLLDISRITRGRLELKRKPIDLTQVLGNAIEMASPAIEQRMHRLETNIPASGLWVEGDEERLSQVFANLLINAARYTDQGGHISLTATEERRQILVRVRDSGIGIKPDLLPMLFDVFVQGEESVAQDGLGLGLAIVKNLVSLHDGTVSVTSEGLGKGSEFVVKLPAIDPNVALASVAVESVAPPVGVLRRMLVVDDNPDSVELLREGMEMLGYEVRTASDGLAAVQIATDFQPEVVLLDIGLPVMDGYEVSRRIREMPELRPIKLVAITGYSRPIDRERIRDAGFDAHLIKPLYFDRIQSTLDDLFRKEESEEA